MTEQPLIGGEIPQTPGESQPEQPETETVEALKLALEQAQKNLKAANFENAARRKALETLEAEKKAKEEAELSELEKANKRAEEAETRLNLLEHARLQEKAALKFKLPSELAERLKGNTIEELEADAEALAKLLPKVSGPLASPTNPGAGAELKETEAQKVARLLGSPPNIFSPEYSEAHGGGVFITNKNSED